MNLKAGIARACFNADACIIDSGITTGIEKYAMRRGNFLFFSYIIIFLKRIKVDRSRS